MRPRFAESSLSRPLIAARPPASLMALCVVAASLLLPGCVYRMTIQQGNFLEERAITQLQVGMTRSQVRYLLGTPMVPDAFDKDRWDYLYYLKKGRLRSPEQRHLIVYFEDEKVARVDNQDARPMPPADQRQTEPDATTPPATAATPTSTN
jgi:outer membrane protein assembly factor BamE